ncbi:cyclin-O-like [Mya arenaria]|uniref:cyclin-O-like n=1 Tax=Mya arenaria TaxID=6604 RepID=UPI0022E2583B|nr:cyclin-O-like [Mya arenaria]
MLTFAVLRTSGNGRPRKRSQMRSARATTRSLVRLNWSRQTTPIMGPGSVSLCDSGLQESVSPSVDLRRLEDMWEFPSTRRVKDAQCSFTGQEHYGFEDYVDDIFAHRLNIESKYRIERCLRNQPEISPDIRKKLIKWLTAMHHDFALCQDTLYLAVHVFDRVLTEMEVSSECLELVVIASLLVACKQVKQSELIVLMATCFDLMAPTVLQFLEYYASFSLVTCTGDAELTDSLKAARDVSRCALELSLQDYELCQFPPSVLALCVWRVAVEKVNYTIDMRTVHYTCDFPKLQLETCIAQVHKFFKSFKQSGQEMSSLYEKYGNL